MDVRKNPSRKISVILPAKNAAATLDAAIASLQAQMLRPERVFLVDDDSSDSTGLIARAWEKKWDAVRVLAGEGRGIGAALNLAFRAALAEADCEWIARMDADDISRPRRFAAQLALAIADPEIAFVGAEVAHGNSSADSEGMRRHIEWANARHAHADLEHALWTDSPLPHPAWFVRRDAFEKVGDYDESGAVPEDFDWLHRFFARADAEGFRAGKPKGEILLDWNESPTRLTRTSSAYSEAAFNRVKVNSLARRFAERADSPEIYVLGLGPKAKLLLPGLKAKLGEIRAIVDVHPRRVGMVYQGTEVWSVERWATRADPARSFALACVGTEATREECFRLCRSQGLMPGLGYIGL